MSIIIDDVCDLFERYLWSYKKIDEKNVRSGFKGTTRSFLIDASLQTNILTLGVWDFLPSVPQVKQAEIYGRLLELNAEISLVKYALSGSEIVLLADMPAEDRLDYKLFVYLIEMLAFYSDDCYSQLYKRITDHEPPEVKNHA